ncbi:MAG: UDP-N-acetylglucosamine 2-epimerase (non-hydrolyzing) [Chlamydiia bacterium]|nr:UDP-N-acetylglucosamine 2-epimerase (non-hydrolyzing) [Chlamydiia bacterium]
MYNILCCFGTRPEIIKMAPLIHIMQKEPEIHFTTLSLDQHQEMLDQMLHIFEITPNHRLSLMQPNQSLTELSASMPQPLANIINQVNPHLILGQGDTAAVFQTSLAAFHHKIPFGHVEAGLRSHNPLSPYPEEIYRQLISRLATLHFAPTPLAKQNLINEGIEPQHISIVGNPVIDALFHILAQKPHLPPEVDHNKQLILVTLHRRENWHSLIPLCQTLRTLADNNPYTQFLLPIHPNPNVSAPIQQALRNHPQITLTPPLPYNTFVATMQHATLILSDSGGIQEEAPALGTPVLILRNETERQEAVTLNLNRLIGTDPDSVYQHVHALLNSPEELTSMIQNYSPYGDGQSAEKITQHCKQFLCKMNARKAVLTPYAR